MNRRNIEKYLSCYAEPSVAIASAVADQGFGTWDQVLAVPACAERESIEALCQSVAFAAKKCSCHPLVILVINHRQSAAQDIKQNNAKTWAYFLESLEQKSASTDGTPWLLGSLDGVSYLVVDAFSAGHEFPEKQGVGLARKIGSDLACALIFRDLVKCPYIFNTDADALIPSDYFQLGDLEQTDQAMGSFFTPFTHTIPANSSHAEAMAITLYDRFLHIYVAGLDRAGSPYAFPTVGSTIGYHVNAYAAVRGFPRREAGEDFYLLNKLAKVGPIRCRKVMPIILQGRVSFRVPFGTGASVGRIAAALEGGQEYRIYDHRSYDLLKIWLDQALQFLNHGSSSQLVINLSKEFTASGVPHAQQILVPYLESSGAFAALQTSRTNTKDPARMARAFHDWFDGFRTLKFVHIVRDELLPPQPLRI